MRLPAFLGSLVALLVGIIAVTVVVAAISGQPPIQLTLPPTTNPVAMLPTPSPTPEPTPTTGEVTPSPSAGASTVPVGTEIGQRAPDFTLPHVAGSEISLHDSAGKPVWVNFMASWCPPCEDELPMMQRMRGNLGDAIDFILVDVGEDEDTVSEFLVRIGVDLPIGLDQDASVQAEWRAFVLPVHFFLDGEGVVQEIVFGGAPPDVFEEAVLKVVPEAEFPAEP